MQYGWASLTATPGQQFQLSIEGGWGGFGALEDTQRPHRGPESQNLSGEAFCCGLVYEPGWVMLGVIGLHRV